MSALKKVGKLINGVEEWLSIISFLAMTIVVIIIVLCRYVFEISFMQGEEIARYLMIWCGYSGAAYGFRKRSHVGVVVFAEMMPEKWHPTILKIRFLLSTIIVFGLFIFACMCLNQYLATGQLTTSTKVPTAMVFAVIPFSMALGTIHSAIDTILAFRSKPENEGEVVA